jgi:4-amino-4-deoxychorismate lyase
LLTGRLVNGELYLCKQQASINESLAGLKHLNRLENVQARNEWSSRHGKNIIDGLMVNASQHVIEGTMSNLFAVKNKQLFTPDLTQSGIKGVMRDQIIEIANTMGIAVSIVNMSIDELFTMDELFITNSLIGMKSVNKLAGKQYKEANVTNSIFEKLLKTKGDYVQVV